MWIEEFGYLALALSDWSVYSLSIPTLAPPHCLQYFDSTQGKIKSFNYDARNLASGDEREMSTAGGAAYEGYPNNIDYLICIRKETGFCSVSYEYMADSSGSVMPFSVGSDLGLAGRRGSQSRIASDVASSDALSISFGSTAHCEDDYLIIGGLRVCSKALASNVNGDDDHVTLVPSSTAASSSSSPPSTAEIFSSTESTTEQSQEDTKATPAESTTSIAFDGLAEQNTEFHIIVTESTAFPILDNLESSTKIAENRMPSKEAHSVMKKC